MEIELPDKTIRDVESFLEQSGETCSVSEFIDRTVQRALFFETVREVKRLNAGKDLGPIIEEAVRAAKR